MEMVLNKVSIKAEMLEGGTANEKIILSVEDQEPIEFFPDGSVVIDGKIVREKARV